MGAPPTHDTRPFKPEHSRWLFPDAHLDIPPASEPGIIVSAVGATAILSAVFRPDDNAPGGMPQMRDTVALVDGVIAPSSQEAGERLIGMEGEAFVIDTASGDDISVNNIGTDEFLKPQIEANSEPFISPFAVTRSLHGHLIGFTQKLHQKYGPTAALDPASALMQRKTTPRDVRVENPYMRRVSELLPKSHEFAGAGVHIHIDVPTELAPLIANYVRLVAPYLNLPLQSAPFAFGETLPRLGEEYDDDRLRPYDGRTIQSVRYPSRLARLNHGGVGIKVAHDTVEGALRQSEARLLRRESNHPARLYGNHADVRIRFDAVDETRRDGTARIEVCVFDTGAYRIETLTAVTGLLKSTVEQLQTYATDGEEGRERLHTEYPHLFGVHPGVDGLSENLELAEENSIQMAYDGYEADVFDYSGHPKTARDIFWQLYAFAAKDHSPSLVVRKPIFEKAAVGPDQLAAHIASSRGSAPSLHNYYVTGYGTPATWIRAYDEALEAQSVSRHDRWRLAAHDRAVSLQRHLAETAQRSLLMQV